MCWHYERFDKRFFQATLYRQYQNVNIAEARILANDEPVHSDIIWWLIAHDVACPITNRWALAESMITWANVQ